MTKFIKYPFAQDGDKTPIPNTDQIDGSVSYQQGFGLDYQKKLLLGDPTAKAIPRQGFNQIMYDTTSNIQQYQTQGFPNFITSADNDGSPYPYDIYAIVRYDAGSGVQLYQSIVNNNTSLPTDNTKWVQLSLVANSGILAILSFQPTTVQSTSIGSNIVQFDNIVKSSPFVNISSYGFIPLISGWWEVNFYVSVYNLSNGDNLIEIFKNSSRIQAPDSMSSLDYASSPPLVYVFKGSLEVFVNGSTDLINLNYQRILGGSSPTIGSASTPTNDEIIRFSIKFISP